MPTAPLLYLAPGHGGQDSGAVSPGGSHNERDQAVIITSEVARILRAEGFKVDVDPPDLDTHETIARVNKKYPKYGLCHAWEIHRDSADGILENAASFRFGVFTGTSPYSVGIGRKAVEAMKAAGAHKTSWNRKHTSSGHGSLGWIRQVRCLSHLLECAFVQGNNSNEHLLVLARIAAVGIKAGYLNA